MAARTRERVVQQALRMREELEIARMHALCGAEDHGRAGLRPDRRNRRIVQFMRRGRVAVQSELRLVAATHNMLKLHKDWIVNTG